MSKRLLFALLGTLAFGPAAFPAVFTGVVPTDFSGTDVVSVTDPLGDVSVPSFNAPPGTIPGWDMAGAHFELNRTTGTLAVGLDFFGIAGDADGNGIDGSTAPWLAANGGADYANLANSESICIAFDFDQNGSYEVIAGDSFFGTAGSIGVYAFAASPFGLSTSFGAPLPANSGAFFYAPNVATPDFEIALTNVGTFEDLSAQTVCFNFQVFAGANWDDGIGEDFILGEACFTDDGQVEAHVLPTSPDMVRAFPNPFNPTTTLAVELAETGNVELSIFNLNGQKVQTLVNGSLSAGSHQLSFNAAGLPSGMYLARLSTVSGEQVTRLVLTK
jgi:hypothetical protein